MTLREIKLENLEIHELAELTPTMTEVQFNTLVNSIAENGQELPIVTYRGKVIDGRHRVKALRELGLTTVKAVSEDSSMSIEDIKHKILNVYENRRHQTSTQKAIMAYRMYAEGKAKGEKVSQGAIANLAGTTRKQLARAKELHGLAGDVVIELLFQGQRINTGTMSQPNNTDSLATLIAYYKKVTEELVENTETTKINEDFTDEEITLSNQVVRELTDIHSKRMIKRICTMLYYSNAK